MQDSPFPQSPHDYAQSIARLCHALTTERDDASELFSVSADATRRARLALVDNIIRKHKRIEVSYNTAVDIMQIVASQIPRTVLEKIEFDLESDAYFLSTTVVVTLPGGRELKQKLEPMPVGGFMRNLKVPDEFLALLSVMA